MFVLRRTAAGIVKLPFKRILISIDTRLRFSCLFGHISLTINWEPLNVTFLVVAGREQFKQILNKIIEDQYTIKTVFSGVFVEQ